MIGWIEVSPGKYLIFILLIVFSGCTSTWDDDDGNWQRIYNRPKPDYVSVIHSRYSRQALLNNEYDYFFQTNYNPRVLDMLLDSGDLVRVNDVSHIEQFRFFPELRPPWFVPEPMDKYEIWTGSWKKHSQHQGYFKLFVDKQKKHLFWCDSHI